MKVKLIPSSPQLFLFTFALVGFLHLWLTVEWTFPYCSSQEDGPASAVFGFPFPYKLWSQASSGEYLFWPHYFLLNWILLSFVVYFPLKITLTRLSGSTPKIHKGFQRLATGLMMLLCAASLLDLGSFRPVFSWSFGETYSDLRPIAISIGNHYDCTPSSYWFPEK